MNKTSKGEKEFTQNMFKQPIYNEKPNVSIVVPTKEENQKMKE